MALLSRKEFAEKCGVSPSYLNNYIRRGKVVLKNNKVDPNDPDNEDFYYKRINGSEPPPRKEKKPELPTELTPEEKEEQERKRREADRRQDATVKKLEAEARLKQLQAAKLSGEAMPLNIAMDIIQQLSQSFITGFNGFCENLVLKISHEARLTKEQTADLRKSILNGMNVSIDNSVEQAKIDLQKMSDEYKSKAKK